MAAQKPYHHAGATGAPDADDDAGGIRRHAAGEYETGFGHHALLLQPDRSGGRALPDSQSDDPAHRGGHHGVMGVERSVWGRFTFAGRRPRASLSGPRPVPGDGSLCQLLPLLHAVAAGEQRDGV